ncbi:hypothetical protein [Pseudobythopirellula maris]|uniref:hypothetical protein n=1 Tax=Pseudobythopirellula maris TaxID=2527991 RepID=UPI0011B71AD1|nr:hypothetical protein [Pseudobythopirellula maris]
MILLVCIALIGFLAVTWPQFFFPALGLLWLASAVWDIRNRYRTIKTLGQQYDQIEAGESATFVGLYRPHWEIGHIQIALTKRWLGFIPSFESWSPYFIAEFPVNFDTLENDSNFLIKFVGTPTDRGQYGHMGSMCREIRIAEFLDVEPIPKNAA